MKKKKINMSEVFSLSVTVSSVFILSSFHSFFVNQELVVNNSILVRLVSTWFRNALKL